MFKALDSRHASTFSNCRLCRFRHLCYLPGEDMYVIFHNSQSTLHGLPADRHTPALLDMSTVRHHNRQLFNYADLPASQAHQVLHNALMVSTASFLHLQWGCITESRLHEYATFDVWYDVPYV